MKNSYKEMYSEAASHALAGFQLIEQSLKEYIDQYYSTLQKIINNKLTFKYEPKEIENAPLGRLCSIFSKLNNNEALINKIKSYKSHRDQLAHRALVLLFEQDTTEQKYKEEFDKYIQVSKENGSALEELRQEKIKLVTIDAIQ